MTDITLTRIETMFVRRIIGRHGSISRHSLPPHDVRTGRRLERKGVVSYPDDGCFRLTDAGRAWARSRGMCP